MENENIRINLVVSLINLFGNIKNFFIVYCGF